MLLSADEKKETVTRIAGIAMSLIEQKYGFKLELTQTFKEPNERKSVLMGDKESKIDEG